MFGFSLIKTSKLNHLYSEVSGLAIENINLNKDVTRRDVTIKELDLTIKAERATSAILAGKLERQQRKAEYLKRVIAGLRADKHPGARKKKR